jgi:hypothetical protein
MWGKPCKFFAGNSSSGLQYQLALQSELAYCVRGGNGCEAIIRIDVIRQRSHRCLSV